jgi:hypothetical protein
MKKWLFFLSLGMMVNFSFGSFSHAPAKISVYKQRQKKGKSNVMNKNGHSFKKSKPLIHQGKTF